MLGDSSSQYGQMKSAQFEPRHWARNPHIQTIYPKFFLRTPEISFERVRIDTPDKDFLDLGILRPDNQKEPRAIALVFHGLEGSEKSHYIQHLAAQLKQQNIMTIVMHFRGCSGEINRQARAYHSGETEDAMHTILWIKNCYPQAKLFGVGFSLGGNMLLKLLGEQDEVPLIAAASVSAPIHLAASAEAINKGFARRYQAHLLKSMKANLIKKCKLLEMRQHLEVSVNQIENLSSFRDFDEHVTSRLHGFNGADDYYKRCSALPFLSAIRRPTLILHAADDPFMDNRVIPTPEDLSPNIAYELSQYGGHVGFMGNVANQKRVSGTPDLWLPLRIGAFIEEHL